MRELAECTNGLGRHRHSADGPCAFGDAVAVITTKPIRLSGALHTYGLDVGYAITPEWDASIGYYYQHGDDLTANDANGVLAQLAYEITDGLTLGVNVSYDEAFETRVSGNIEYRFGSGNASTAEKKTWQTPVIQSLTESVKNRDVRVHDANKISGQKCKTNSVRTQQNNKEYHCQTTVEHKSTNNHWNIN